MNDIIFSKGKIREVDPVEEFNRKLDLQEEVRKRQMQVGLKQVEKKTQEAITDICCSFSDLSKEIMSIYKECNKLVFTEEQENERQITQDISQFCKDIDYKMKDIYMLVLNMNSRIPKGVNNAKNNNS